VVGYRTVKVREDVYQRLARLTDSSGKSMSDLIEDLLNNYEGGVGNGVVERLGRIEFMLRDCLDRLGVRETEPIETRQTEPVSAVPKGGASDSAFEDNPWVQILKTKYRP
jgi:negative regulator of replication initiation